MGSVSTPGQLCGAWRRWPLGVPSPGGEPGRVCPGRGLPPEAAGVGEDQVGTGHEVVHLGHVQGSDQVDPGVVTQEAVGAVLDHGAQVDGGTPPPRWDFLYNGPDGGENGLHGGAVVLLPPVAGEGDHLFFREIQAVQGLVLEDKVPGTAVVFMASITVLPSDENLSLDGLPP